MAGRPRPNFYAYCGWNSATQTCSSHHAWDARQSFPSGHSSSSFASMGISAIVMLVHLHPKLTTRKVPAVLSFLFCTSPLWLAGWIASSRLTDYFHHYSGLDSICVYFDITDVICGSLIGFSIAIGMFYARKHPSVETSTLQHVQLHDGDRDDIPMTSVH
jgi:diacylglycerol diphosphate phosphatase / phosphatidate phosphatase